MQLIEHFWNDVSEGRESLKPIGPFMLRTIRVSEEVFLWVAISRGKPIDLSVGCGAAVTMQAAKDAADSWALAWFEHAARKLRDLGGRTYLAKSEPEQVPGPTQAKMSSGHDVVAQMDRHRRFFAERGLKIHAFALSPDTYGRWLTVTGRGRGSESYFDIPVREDRDLPPATLAALYQSPPTTAPGGIVIPSEPEA